MAEDHSNELHKLNFVSRHGVLVNSNDGFYQHGKSFGIDIKLFVMAKYLNHKERLVGLRPVLTKVPAECQVGRDFVAKNEHELMENERVLVPEDIWLMLIPLDWDQRVCPKRISSFSIFFTGSSQHGC
jgi:hypothetical protein